ALQSTRMVGRLDRRAFRWQGKSLTILMDVGHNPHAAEYLARRLAARPVQGKRLAVFGLLVDKDLDGVVQPLLGAVQGWAVAPLDTPRSRPAHELQTVLASHGAGVKCYSSVADALEGQCALATADDEILLFGSFFCVGEALQWLDRQATEDGANGIAG
ncbi:MAG: glutamate ligase domain-containing protein, partial [Pseudomonas sp.]